MKTTGFARRRTVALWGFSLVQPARGRRVGLGQAILLMANVEELLPLEVGNLPPNRKTGTVIGPGFCLADILEREAGYLSVCAATTVGSAAFSCCAVDVSSAWHPLPSQTTAVEPSAAVVCVA